jgi:soluble lytic murein transglycosylase
MTFRTALRAGKRELWTKFGRLAGISAVAVAMSLAALAQSAPPPSRKPPPSVPTSTALPGPDFGRLQTGLNAARAGDGASWRRALDQTGDRTARRVMLWAMATGDAASLPFSELNAATSELVGFPGAQTVRSRAEDRIGEGNLGAAGIVSWFASQPPTTGGGKVALAVALADLGRTMEADTWARDAWVNHTLNSTREGVIIARFPHLGTPDEVWKRVDHLLWENDRSGARRLASRLDGARRTLLDARISLMERTRRSATLVRGVPDSLSEDPGLLYQRARAERRSDDEDSALDFVARFRSSGTQSRAGREAMWEMRRWAANRLLERGQPSSAYAILADHGLSVGTEYFDAEFRAGWVALRRLNQADRAVTHFVNLDGVVTTPISRARAAFWLSEAALALGRTAERDSQLSRASQFPTAFYGQLALERTGQTLSLPAPLTPTADERRAFEARDDVRAARMLADAGETDLFRRMTLATDDRLDVPVEHELLSELARGYLDPGLAIRAAKAGVGRNIIATGAAYPIMPLSAGAQRSGTDPALILGLSRQESEFNPRAISPAGARGLMQFMPATARAVARRHGLGYQQSWLLDDPAYNMTLGGLHLKELLDEFRGSYALVAVAYNAGPSRATDWLARFGDLRSRSVDAIDWVEQVPFTETRDYIMRVVENVQVYRHRLANRPLVPTVERDLKGG